MKQRGRHRRRKRGQALRATLAGTALALTAAATMISASQAEDGARPGPLKPLTSAVALQELRLDEETYPATPGPALRVADVLADADHALRPAADCPASDRSALPVTPAAADAWCWDEPGTDAARAGAVTGSGDADDDGRWGEHRVLLSGWSDPRGRARIAVVDAERMTYAWVQPVVPADGGRSLRPLRSPLSGLVWYQDKLLATGDEGRTLYVYDMDRVRRTSAGTEGPSFQLPAERAYRLAGDTRIGALSLDRSTAPDSLAVSEATPADTDRPARLWRYALETDVLAPDAGLPDPAPVEAFETEAAGVQGVLTHRSRWYLARSAGAFDGHGTLVRLDGDGAGAAQCGPDGTYQCWSKPAASLSYWEESGTVWSQSGRMLFSLGLNTIDRSLD
ncbi:hypothetical protein SUDANB105_01633 [Streptomyces sp. enrichment culture]|uniref:hypothetical protein n=1 Tax=Streptomyces sp. enrichment culture TaxID=1795815 RepID=UPI003F57329D